MRLFILHILCIFLAIPFPGGAYRILCLLPFQGISHFVMFDRLMRELASRGHQVDVVSHYPLKKPLPNYNDIVSLAGTVPQVRNNMTYEFATTRLDDRTVVFSIATQFGGDLCDLMDLPDFRKLIENPPNDPPYDLLLTEVFGSPCYLALGQHFKVPIIGVATSLLWPWVSDMVANPDNPSYIPHTVSGLSGKLNFWQRLRNTLTLWKAKWEFSYYSAYQNDKIKKYIGPDAPSLDNAEKDVALILVNSHYSLQGVRPFTAAVVEVGGLHIQEKQDAPLPNDLQKWLDDSTDGFILITLGSMVRIETLPKETLTAIYSSVRKLAPVRFLIKIVKKEKLLPGLPSNVFTLPWIPQSAILQHKNIRAFVTHGGLMGTQEAVYYGVPIVGIPLFSDQGQNIDLCVQKNMAVSLSHVQLTEENLDNAFNTILHDPSYAESAKKLSAEFQNRPMSALDTAIYWIEYVIRHGGSNLRSPALDLAWWEIALLDVYGALFAGVALVVYLLTVVMYKVKSVAFGGDVKRVLSPKKYD